MPRQQRKKSKSGYYHVIMRGNERMNIFRDEKDKHRFIKTLSDKKLDDKKQKSRFFLYAFCLMDNHVHLIMSEGAEDIAKVMKRISVSYVHYFNKKYKRVGHLFQDRFMSEPVEDDNYLLALVRYIHQNPVKAGMVKSAGEYSWSSYNCYVNDNCCFLEFIQTDSVLCLISANKDTAKKLFEEYMNEEVQEVFNDLVEDVEVMSEEMAKGLYKRMLILVNNLEGNPKELSGDFIT